MKLMVIWASPAGILELMKRMQEHKFDFQIEFVQSGVAYLTSSAIRWSHMELWLAEIRKQVETDFYPEMVGL